MEQNDSGWKVSLKIPPGNYEYRFIVYGRRILDPANKLWEENEYGTGNSVLWITP
jgi:hypothetical protein